MVQGQIEYIYDIPLLRFALRTTSRLTGVPVQVQRKPEQRNFYFIRLQPLMITRSRTFDHKLSLSIDAIHHKLEQAQRQPMSVRKLRMLLVLKQELRKLERRIKA